jgi:hypothetical protein
MAPILEIPLPDLLAVITFDFTSPLHRSGIQVSGCECAAVRGEVLALVGSLFGAGVF